MSEKIFYYIAEPIIIPSGKSSLSIKKEINKSEVEEILHSQSFVEFYSTMTMMKDVVISNGNEFTAYMSAENLVELRSKNVDIKTITLNANRMVYNFAVSVMSYVDREKRILRRNKTSEKQEEFEALCRAFYDNDYIYRFWANFRNYVVHYELPYYSFFETAETGPRIVCFKEHLLRYSNWKHTKSDICNMEDEIDLTQFVKPMKAIIESLYIDFFAFFGLEIENALFTYHEFGKKNGVKAPLILRTKFRANIEDQSLQNIQNIVKHAQTHTLSIKALYECYKMLENNPRVEIIYPE